MKGSRQFIKEIIEKFKHLKNIDAEVIKRNTGGSHFIVQYTFPCGWICRKPFSLHSDQYAVKQTVRQIYNQYKRIHTV